MAGHSKWSNIRRKKEINDAKKSKIFTKLIKEITVATQCGGSEPAFNPRLRLAVQNAKGANMPKEAILRAIRKGNDVNTDNYHEATYEGYGSQGVAIMVVCMTDKITRTVAHLRSIFNKYGGSLEKSGSVSFLFQQKGIFTIPMAAIQSEEQFTLSLIDVGVEELENEDDDIHAICSVAHFGAVQKQLEKLTITPTYSGLHYMPNSLVEVGDIGLPKLVKLIETLRDEDDVQQVFHNIAMQKSQEELWAC